MSEPLWHLMAYLTITLYFHLSGGQEHSFYEQLMLFECFWQKVCSKLKQQYLTFITFSVVLLKMNWDLYLWQRCYNQKLYGGIE